MPVYLSAPKCMTSVPPNGYYRDFYTILQNGVGSDYGIYRSLIGQIHAGDKVVVFDRDRRLQAEGVVASVVPTSKSPQGVQRYDIRIRNLATVSYSAPPRVNRFGVAVLP